MILAKSADHIEPLHTGTSYPKAFASKVAGRHKRRLGDHFGLSNFGVNLTTLEAGAASALLHRHTTQDEFVYVLSGEIILRVEGQKDQTLQAGDCVGFPKSGPAHQLVNRSDNQAIYLEIGDRSPGDRVSYPENDLLADLIEGQWVFSRRDGSHY